MPSRCMPTVIRRPHDGVRAVWDATAQLEGELHDESESAAFSQRASARNRVQHLAIRRHDIRALQIELGHLGRSSLGRLEGQVSAALESVLHALGPMGTRAG